MFLVFLGVLVVVSVDDYENWNLRFTFIFKTLALVLIAQLLKNIVDNLSQLRLIVSEEEKYSTAVHEAGHTIVAILLGINIKKVTIKRHFFYNGKVLLDYYNKILITNELYKKIIQVTYAGKVAQDILLGFNTGGNKYDLQKATEICLKMICNYGMSEQLLVKIPRNKHFNNIITEKNVEIAEKICKECYEKCYMLIKDNKALIEEFANNLIEKSELNEDDINNFRKKHNI
ncbi:MAG: hypothetical protein J6N78_05150 [Clostridia bacterium]|nr:hypothetical protein [Clostridia bacterium]